MANKLKIAVCFFGHLRTFQQCAPSLKEHLLRHYDCDLFMHTWSKLDHNTQTWHKNTENICLTNQNDIVNAYGKFRAISIEEQKVEDYGVAQFSAQYNSKPSKMSLFGLNAMYHSMQQANTLRREYEKKNHIQYDYVVCLRPDILLNRTVDIEALLEGLDPDECNRGFFTMVNPLLQAVKDFSSLGAGDCFFFARPEVIDKIINDLPDARKVFDPDIVYRFAPEYELIKVVQSCKYTPYQLCFLYNRDFLILRLPQKEKLRKRVIRLRLFKDGKVIIWLFPKLLPHIFDVRATFFNLTLDIALGNPERDI